MSSGGPKKPKPPIAQPRANRNDSILLEPTLQAVAARGLLADSNLTTERCQSLGITDIVCAKKKRKGETKTKKPLTLGLRWPLNAPTPGSRTSASYAATPTGSANNDSDRSPSPSPSILTVKLVKWAKRWTD